MVKVTIGNLLLPTKYISSQQTVMVLVSVHKTYPCVTLSTLLGDNASYFVNTSNTTVHFLPGTHTVTDIALTNAVVHNVSNLTLSGACSNTGHCPPATVRCNGTFSFIFSDVSSLKISNIAFIECGAVVPGRLSDFVYSILATTPRENKWHISAQTWHESSSSIWEYPFLNSEECDSHEKSGVWNSWTESARKFNHC